jgi:hypothetical protein
LPHLGRGFVQLALGLVDLVARGVVGLADGFEVGLDRAQVGHARFEVVHGLQAIQAHLGLLASASARFKNHCWCCLSVASACSVLYLGGHLGLLFELFEVGVQLAQDVFHPGEVLARVVQAVFVSRRRSLYLETPAASSRNRRSSSGRLSMMRLMVPWPMMA